MVKKIRKIDGKYYKLSSEHKYKRKAGEAAFTNRSIKIDGKRRLARIIKGKKMGKTIYRVYVCRKFIETKKGKMYIRNPKYSK